MNDPLLKMTQVPRRIALMLVSGLTASASCQADGLSREVWTNVPIGNYVQQFTTRERFLVEAPNVVEVIEGVEPPQDWGNDYFQRLRGYITAPVTGQYRFWIAGDNNCQLFLSDGESKFSTQKIAYLDGAGDSLFVNFREWDRHPSQASQLITLEAGKRYYVEILHKEWFGGDHLSVAWEYPGQVREVIPATAVEPFVIDSNDQDNDDLPDDWELANNLNPASRTGSNGPAGDPDNDGIRNIEEWKFGTDPKVAGPVPGHLFREVWHSIGGSNVIDLVNSAKFREEPDRRDFVAGSSSAVNEDDYFGSRLRGAIVAPITGDYTFWIAGDDSAELWVSTTSKKFERQKVAWVDSYTEAAQWERFDSQRSAPVRLVAGQEYYLEVLHKESFGGDHVSLAWEYQSSDMSNWARTTEATATQSTTEFGGVASLAIDGKTGGTYWQNKGTQTNDAPGNWWQVDLGSDRPIQRVVLFNRTDSNRQRLSNFRVSVHDQAGNEIEGQDFHINGSHVEGSLVWDLPAPTTGHSVRVEMLGSNLEGNGILSLAEVQVWGSQSTSGSTLVPREPIPAANLRSYAKESNDQDDDNLPDDWEVDHGLNPADSGHLSVDNGAFGDPDQDFMPNWVEYQRGSNPQVAESMTHALLHEVWTGVEGFEIDTLRKSPKFVQPPNHRGPITTTEGTTNYGEAYGSRFRGFITAPSTGSYTFWLAGDNRVEFYLSSDDDKFNRQLLLAPRFFTQPREWDLDASQRSVPVNLVAGRKYYVEIWHKESSGDDNVSLAWQAPGGNRELIPAEHLSTYASHSNDVDDDDLPDDWEIANGLNPADKGSGNFGNGAWGDLDNDGIANIDELKYGTKANNADSDGDGVSDYDEINVLNTQALVGDVAPFQTVQTVNGSAFTGSEGEWGTEDTVAFTKQGRGSVDYSVNPTSGGVYLLNLSLGARGENLASENYEVVFYLGDTLLGRVRTAIPNGTVGEAKVLTPWLPAGNHSIRAFVDNTYTFRQVELKELKLQKANGTDSSGNGVPDWVDSRLATANSIDSSFTTSKVSPTCVEGKARYPKLATANIPGGAPVALQAAPGDRWFANVPLQASGAVSLQVGLENGAVTASLPVAWVPTNLLTESTINLRQGDSLRLSAWFGNTANGADKVWLTIDGETYHFKGNEPMEWQFATAGTQVIDLVHRNGNGNSASEITRQITVNVQAMPTIASPVCVSGSLREWNVSHPAGTTLEIDSRVNVRSTQNLGSGSWHHEIEMNYPEDQLALVRLGTTGSILGTVPIRGLSVADGNKTSVTMVEGYGDGSFRVEMPVVVSKSYSDITVHYDIFEAGVTFLDGSIEADCTTSDFDGLGRHTLNFLKLGKSGSACHRASVWQNGVRIALFF